MNLFKQLQSRRHRECVDGAAGGFETLALEEPRCFCGPSSSSSSTKQEAENYQVALQTAGQAPGVAVGSGGSTGAIGITTTTDSGNTVVSGDTLTAALALSLANNAITTDQAAGVQTAAINAALAGHTVDEQTALVSGVLQNAQDMAGQSIVGAQEQADNAEGVVATIAGQAMDTATNLGGAALDLAGGVANEAFNFAQNESVLNYNALNQNTALAFSTISALSTAQASGAISAEAADLARVAGQIGTQSGGATTVVVPPASTSPTAAASTDTGSMSAGTLTLIGIALAALYFLFPKGVKQLTG